VIARAAVVLALAAALAPAAHAGSGDAWRVVRDPAAGFSIAVPAGWRVVPRSTPALKALVVRLRGRKQVALSNQLTAILAARRNAPSGGFRFQAFAWPPPDGQIVPDVSVKVDAAAPKATARDLPVLAKQIERALGSARGTTVEHPVAERLPAGHGIRLAGTVRLGKTSRRSGFTLHLLLRGRRLYSLSFRGPAATTPRLAELQRTIAQRFRIT
jgi:hypothetical protein